MPEVQSSQIAAIDYDPESRRLSVRFHDRVRKDGTRVAGGTYDYDDIAPDEHHALLTADSIGSHFHHHFRKPARPFTRRAEEEA
jgi:hypothetical protein